jgi:ADP-ribosylglycohydrolase
VAEAIGYGRQLHPATLTPTGQTFLADDAAGFVLDSLSMAVAAVLDPRPLPDVAIDIVRIGNDTDTNAAIAGGLLGIRDTASRHPRHVAIGPANRRRVHHRSRHAVQPMTCHITPSGRLVHLILARWRPGLVARRWS